MSPLFSRHILACLHFNENLRRETQVSKDGKPYMRVTYPKFKLSSWERRSSVKLHALQVMVSQHEMGTILHLTKNL